MKKSIKKLQLNKLAVAQLSNYEQTKGGNTTLSFECPEKEEMSWDLPCVDVEFHDQI